MQIRNYSKDKLFAHNERGIASIVGDRAGGGPWNQPQFLSPSRHKPIPSVSVSDPANRSSSSAKLRFSRFDVLKCRIPCGERYANLKNSNAAGCKGNWWARQDLNLGPTDYESAALTAELQART